MGKQITVDIYFGGDDYAKYADRRFQISFGAFLIVTGPIRDKKYHPELNEETKTIK